MGLARPLLDTSETDKDLATKKMGAHMFIKAPIFLVSWLWNDYLSSFTTLAITSTNLSNQSSLRSIFVAASMSSSFLVANGNQ